MKPRKLSKKAFVHALKNGLGSALLHAKQYSDRGVEKELLQACLTNYVYDTQTCQARGYWLARILDHTNEIGIYAEAIKKALLRSSKRGKDFDQLVILSTELFERGFGEFKDLLLQLPPVEDYQEAPLRLGLSLIDVASCNGFDTAARMMIQTTTENWEKEGLFDHFGELLGEEEAVSYINEKIKEDPVFAEFWANVQSEVADFEQTKTRGPVAKPPFSLEQIIVPPEEIVPFQLYSNRYRRFGETATDEDLQRVFDALEVETDRARLYNYLSVFHNRPLPVVSRKVVGLLKSDAKNLRRAARNALSLLQSPIVRKLALKALKQDSDEDIVTGANLITKNFKISDTDSLLQALRRIQHIDSHHWATCRTVEIAETINDKKLTDLMIFVVETTPCDDCRASALQRLVEWGSAPAQILYEAQWDVSTKVRTIARDKADVVTNLAIASRSKD